MLLVPDRVATTLSGHLQSVGLGAGEPVTEHAMPKEATFSSQLSWGYNDMVKLQLLPLETNCVLGLIVCCGSHTGSRMLPS